MEVLHPDLYAVISIHALREEGDWGIAALAGNAEGFLSTPSARRATGETIWHAAYFVFLSTPSARRATLWMGMGMAAVRKFLSTPSARRATRFA